jgi:hypothetical protein
VGLDQLDTKQMNPHRVQMYSIEEIWKAVLTRLVKLDVLRDPDDDSEGESEDSTDLEDDFDFIAKAEKRVGNLFKHKRTKKAKGLPLQDQMKQNDYKTVQRMLAKSIEHEKIVLKLKDYDIFGFVKETKD